MKLLGVLLATILFYLVMLHFKVPFGIALVIALAAMWAGVRYVRKEGTEEPAESDAVEEGKEE